MLHGISMYPVIRQCTLLAAILEDSGEKIPTIAGDLVNKPHQHLPCLRGISESASVVNTSALRLATDVHVSKAFNRLSLAYKCLVLSQVARAIHGEPTKSLQKTGRFLQETTATLTQHLPLLDASGKCAGGKSRAITKAYVQLGIRLRKLMPFKVWLKRFKNKLPAVYLRHVSRSGKLSEIVNSWKRDKNGDAVAIIPRDKFVVRVKDAPVQDGNNVVVTFSFLSRQSSGDYTTVDGDDVVAALDAMRPSQLNSLLQAEVIGSSALVGDKSERRHPPRDGKLSEANIARLLAFFPRYLRKFFKSLPSSERCYVLRQISNYLAQDLFLVEKSYHSMGSLHKKHFCSRAAKQKGSRRSKPARIATVWDNVDALCRITPGGEAHSSSLEPNTTALVENARVARETRPFNTMELVMFVLLGFLCVLIMVFVANCFVFTFNTKRLNARYEEDPATIARPSRETTSDGKLTIPENHDNNELAVKISENYQVDEERSYSILVVAPLSSRGKNDSQKSIVVDWTSGLRHPARMQGSHEGRVILREMMNLADEGAEKLTEEEQ